MEIKEMQKQQKHTKKRKGLLFKGDQCKRKVDNNKNVYPRKGLLHHLSNSSLHHSGKPSYNNFDEDAEELCKNVTSPEIVLDHSTKTQKAKLPCEDENKPAGSRFYRKFLKWKKNLSGVKINSKKSMQMFSNNSSKPFDRFNNSTKRTSIRYSSKCFAEEAKKHLSESCQATIAEEGSPLSLINVLRCTESREIFRKFLTKEHSEENVDFWLDVEKYKYNPRPEEAVWICMTYVDPESPREINLSHEVKERINEDLEKQCSLDFLFDDAQFEIFKLMQKDSFVRFKLAAMRR